MRSEWEANRAIERYADMVRRICFVHLANVSDVEDLFQEVFLKYMLHDRAFEGEEHERAWLIRVCINACRDASRRSARRRSISLEDLYEEPVATTEAQRELLDCILRLPRKYRDVIYLHYYEGYDAEEIARILGRNRNTVYTWMKRARERLKEQLVHESLEI